MNLVFVHGRAQGGKNPDTLKQEWLEALNLGWVRAGITPPDLDEVKFPYYADRLNVRVNQTNSGLTKIQARSSSDDDPVALEQEDLLFLQELLQAAEISDEDLNAAYISREVVERGPEQWEWFQAGCRVLANKVPWLADYGIGKVTADVATYLSNPLAKDEVDEIVKNEINSDSVVVAHSLGSVVAYDVLAHKISSLNIPLFMTLGSPLGIPSIKSRLPRLRYPKPPVKAWINSSDERDFIALHSDLNRTFLEGIVDKNHVQNGDDPHSILAYLQDEEVALDIANALKS